MKRKSWDSDWRYFYTNLVVPHVHEFENALSFTVDLKRIDGGFCPIPEQHLEKSLIATNYSSRGINSWNLARFSAA